MPKGTLFHENQLPNAPSSNPSCKSHHSCTATHGPILIYRWPREMGFVPNTVLQMFLLAVRSGELSPLTHIIVFGWYWYCIDRDSLLSNGWQLVTVRARSTPAHTCFATMTWQSLVFPHSNLLPPLYFEWGWDFDFGRVKVSSKCAQGDLVVR